jgi:hypothetical protein
MKRIATFTCIAIGAALVTTATLAVAEVKQPSPPATDKAKPGETAKPDEKPKAKAYPLKTCAVTGEKLDADPAMKSFSFVHEGQEIKLCCKSCKKKFDKDPAGHLKKMNEAVAKEKAAAKPEAPAKK